MNELKCANLIFVNNANSLKLISIFNFTAKQEISIGNPVYM